MIDPRLITLLARQYDLIYRKINIPVNNIITQREKNKIDALCKKYHIENYTINPDGSIDVDGGVSFWHKGLVELPLRFNKVFGNFDCSDNELTSLDGCPITVGGYFDCANNDNITNLLGCPVEVGGHFVCSNNKLTSLEHCPKEIGGGLYCYNNQLTSLEYCPKEIGGDFDCSSNQLTSIEHCPTEISGGLYCYKNKLPGVLQDIFDKERIGLEEQTVFIKYQSYYDVWTPMFNEDGFNVLITEIRDGLL